MHTQQQLLGGLKIEANGIPIYVQLREQFLRLVGAGVLNPGEQMPTMRQVAVALRVDLNTVRHAYDELEQRGVVILVRGRGSFVAASPPVISTAAHDEAAENLARQTLAAATASGVDPLWLAQRIAALAAKEETT